MLIMKKYNRIAAALTAAAIVLLTGCGDTMDHVTIHSTESSSETEMEKSNETEAENSDSVESASVNETDTEYSDAIVDMDEYYAKVSTVIRKIAAEDSKAVQNEQAAVSDITARGFEDFPITINYDEKGQIIQEKEAVEDSNDIHPMYATYYENCYGDLWSIMVINGVIEATPISYIYEHNYEKIIVFTETDTVMSYDNVTNTFYETIPNDDVVTLIKIKRINSQKLDITFEEIDQMLENYISNINK